MLILPPKNILLTIKLINYFLIIIPVLLNVAFITLLERKVLGYRQYRVGPSKVRVAGILQPIADAIKLFSNQLERPYSRNYILFFLSPVVRVFLVLILWSSIPVTTGYHNFTYSIIIIVIVIRFGVYPLLMAGWASNRKYALLGGLRGVSQTISYEIRLALIALTFLVYLNRYSIEGMLLNSSYISIIFLAPMIILLWVVSCLAETNRTPFDFSEGESELVSGFNIEYGSGGFALIFIAEYARIFFLRALTAYIGLGWPLLSGFSHIASVIFVFFWVWARATLPRFRYDLLIRLAWKRILPLTLGALEISIFLLYL